MYGGNAGIGERAARGVNVSATPYFRYGKIVATYVRAVVGRYTDFACRFRALADAVRSTGSRLTSESSSSSKAMFYVRWVGFTHPFICTGIRCLRPYAPVVSMSGGIGFGGAGGKREI